MFANAGIQSFHPLLEMEDSDWQITIDVNLTGTANAVRAFAPYIVKRGGGRIILTSSTQGQHGTKYGASYSASKWGLRGITKSFALEVGQHNINVNYVAPGMVDGPRFRDKVCADMAKRFGITLEQAMQRHAADYALRRVTTDIDVANACLFLASDVSRQLTGVDLPVDGGWAML